VWAVDPVRHQPDDDLAFALDVFTRFLDTVVDPSRIDDDG
jgi:hypothetical protein